MISLSCPSRVNSTPVASLISMRCIQVSRAMRTLFIYSTESSGSAFASGKIMLVRSRRRTGMGTWASERTAFGAMRANSATSRSPGACPRSSTWLSLWPSSAPNSGCVRRARRTRVTMSQGLGSSSNWPISWATMSRTVQPVHAVGIDHAPESNEPIIASEARTSASLTVRARAAEVRGMSLAETAGVVIPHLLDPLIKGYKAPTPTARTGLQGSSRRQSGSGDGVPGSSGQAAAATASRWRCAAAGKRSKARWPSASTSSGVRTWEFLSASMLRLMLLSFEQGTPASAP